MSRDMLALPTESSQQLPNIAKAKFWTSGVKIPHWFSLNFHGIMYLIKEDWETEVLTPGVGSCNGPAGAGRDAMFFQVWGLDMINLIKT